MKRLLSFCFALVCSSLLLFAQTLPTGGATETTPSKSEYFSWINNTNEGPTAEQTLTNLRFFQWLHDRYGMVLDLYAFDAGAIDGAKIYGSMRSERFKKQFPEGFGPLSEQAALSGTRLGIWCGPDGFGSTDSEAQEREDMMASLVEKYHFGLFKMDAVCGQLRPEQYNRFDRMMKRIRQTDPGFVLLNHRLDLGPGTAHSTTFLLGGEETYIDVHMTNDFTATHHRAKALSRTSPKDLTRLTEDHGVCLSSCLDYWEDDLVLQAFGRELILAPEIYANPWLLRDDEFPTLAFLFNLHRDYRDILVKGLRLPAEKYGHEALSRGNATTRFITLRNLTWNPVTYEIQLDSETGLDKKSKRVKVRQYHPYILDLGYHPYGSKVQVTVEPFRATLVKITTEAECDGIALSGIPYQIINDRTGGTTEVKLLGMPGCTYQMTLERCTQRFSSATIDGKTESALLKGQKVSVTFPGQKPQKDFHRHLTTLQPCQVPNDAESIYYATCFAADNNALEARSLKRSGETRIPEVKAARDAFFNQSLFQGRELWDRYLFDSNSTTAFSISFRFGDSRTNSSSGFFLDLGALTELDEVIMESFDEYSITPLKSEEGQNAYLSADLQHWTPVTFRSGTRMHIPTKAAGAFRYLRLPDCPFRLTEVSGVRNGQSVDRSKWHASNLFRTYGQGGCQTTQAWKGQFHLDEALEGSYLCIAVNGEHGAEGAWAGLKVEGKYIGCPDRAPSYKCNPWEFQSGNSEKNYTFYIPITADLIGKDLEAWTLTFNDQQVKPEVWITAYPIPFQQKELHLQRK